LPWHRRKMTWTDGGHEASSGSDDGNRSVRSMRGQPPNTSSSDADDEEPISFTDYKQLVSLDSATQEAASQLEFSDTLADELLADIARLALGIHCHRVATLFTMRRVCLQWHRVIGQLDWRGIMTRVFPHVRHAPIVLPDPTVWDAIAVQRPRSCGTAAWTRAPQVADLLPPNEVWTPAQFFSLFSHLTGVRAEGGHHPTFGFMQPMDKLVAAAVPAPTRPPRGHRPIRLGRFAINAVGSGANRAASAGSPLLVPPPSAAVALISPPASSGGPRVRSRQSAWATEEQGDGGLSWTVDVWPALEET